MWDCHVICVINPVNWDCRIHRLHLCKGIRPPLTHSECSRYDIKQSDGKASIMLELWRIPSTPLLSSLPRQLWPLVVALYKVLSVSQIKLNCVFVLNWIAWNRTFLTIKLCSYAKLKCLIWGICSTPSFPLLPSPLRSRVIVPDRVLSTGQIEQTMCPNEWLMLNSHCYIAIVGPT